MKTLKQLTDKQIKAVNFITNQPASFIIADMGEGKTIITLSAILCLLTMGKIKNALILAPLDVIKLSWPYEIELWRELKGLSFGLAHGSIKRRLEVLKQKHHLYLMNYENFQWLHKYCTELKKNPFDMVVYDESKRMASISNNRFKKWKRHFNTFNYRVCLTATPRPNTAQSLYGQTYLLDSGKSFGHNFSKFQQKHFYPVGKSGYKWAEWPDTNEVIADRIKHLTHRLKGKDRPYDLIDIEIKLPKDLQKQYDDLEKKMFLELKEKPKEKGKKYVLPSKIVSLGKCCQFVGGFVYLETGELTDRGDKVTQAHQVHDLKLKAISEILSSTIKGNRSLVAYEYKHERDGILRENPNAVRFDLDKPGNKALWNRGAIETMLIYPDTSALGLNLQTGGHHLIWYTTPWSGDTFDQMIGRINRAEQDKKCQIYRLVVLNTVDVLKREVLRRRERKQIDFLDLLLKYEKEQGP